MIVVTTPTGGIGQDVLKRLLETSDEAIRVIARDPSRLEPKTRARIEIVEGSHGDAKTVGRAFAGADTVFWLVPPNPYQESVHAAYINFSQPACAALKAQGVKRVVGISALGRGTPMRDRAGLVTASLDVDDMIAATGVSLRALVMPSFMDNFLQQKTVIKEKKMFVSPISADLKAPTAARRDMADVAVRLLRDSSWTGVEDVPVLGPEDLSMNDMAGILSDVLGTHIRFQQISMDAFKARLLERGMSESFAQGYIDMMKAKNEGLDNSRPRTRQATTPTTFRQWCEDVLKPGLSQE